jgi:hypothetical protein
MDLNEEFKPILSRNLVPIRKSFENMPFYNQIKELYSKGRQSHQTQIILDSVLNIPVTSA